MWALAQELSILGELARPTASKCITYGAPFSQLPQREHKKCYIWLPWTNKNKKIRRSVATKTCGKLIGSCLIFKCGEMTISGASLSSAEMLNKGTLLLILWGVSQETGLPGWLSAPIEPDGFLTLNKWIDFCVASLTRFMLFYTVYKGGQQENECHNLQTYSSLLVTWIWLTCSQCLYLLCLTNCKDKALCHFQRTQLTPQAGIIFKPLRFITIIRWIGALSLRCELLSIMLTVFQLLYIVKVPANELWSCSVMVWLWWAVTSYCTLKLQFQLDWVIFFFWSH